VAKAKVEFEKVKEWVGCKDIEVKKAQPVGLRGSAEGG
jgi:hypothetical protein